jgi:DNA-binding response OmpR family regulator
MQAERTTVRVLHQPASGTMRLLAIEDNRDILANVADYLEAQGYTVDCAGNGPHGLHLALTQAYDLMVLDLMLPGIDGYQLCQRLRDAGSEVPIIMLTARDTLDDRLQGLKAGADDYLVKPFALAELAARIEAVLRRTQGGRKRQLQVADLVFDLDGLQISRAGQALRLNPTCQKILELLMRRSPAAVRRELIEEALWGELPPPSDSLRSHIHLLRQAIDKPFARPLLHTLHSVGYRLSDEIDGA